MTMAVAIFFSISKRLHEPWISDCGIDNGFRGSAHHHASYLQVPLLTLHLGYTDRFERSTVCRVPALSTCCSAYTAGADAARSQNGFAILPMVSARRILHLTRNQS